MVAQTPRLILASASPRRRELLTQIGVTFEVRAQDIDETPLPSEAPEDYVRRLAVEKAMAAGLTTEQDSCLPVLGADTIVVCAGRLLGKPTDRQDALGMLKQLSGRTHEVLSAVALTDSKRQLVRMSRTEVRFRELSDHECEKYWLTGEPEGKAGAYAIQGIAAMFVASITGSYSGVVGLPLFETCELLQAFDIPTVLSE